MRILLAILLLSTTAGAFSLPVQFCAQPQFGGGTTQMLRAVPGAVHPWDVIQVRVLGWCRLMDPYYIPGPSHTTLTATLSNATGSVALTSPPIVVDVNSDQYEEPFTLIGLFQVDHGVTPRGKLGTVGGALLLLGTDPVGTYGWLDPADPATTLDLSMTTDVSSCCNLEVVSVQVDPSIPLTPLSAPFGP